MYNTADMMEKRRKAEEEFNRIHSAQDGTHAVPHSAFFVGGRFHGLYMTHEELRKNGNGTFTPRWSVMPEHNDLLVNLDLEDQPMVDGYLSPMWDGGRLRYETQSAYDVNSD